jgi:hypothetical protein
LVERLANFIQGTSTDEAEKGLIERAAEYLDRKKKAEGALRAVRERIAKELQRR